MGKYFKNKIFITGITGFVGSSLVRYFEGRENSLVGHTRDPEQAVKKFNNTAIEITTECSAEVFNRMGIGTVVHLAGIAHDLSDRYRPEDYDRVNYENTKNVFDAFLGSGAGKFIFVSSIKAAVDSAVHAVDEEVTPAPVTAYGKSKQKAEAYIQFRGVPDSKRFYIFRPCMIHGEGNKGNLNLLYRYALSGLPYPLGAFHNQRSFLSIGNFNFIVRHFIEHDMPSGIYHLADDGFLSTLELYRLMAKTSGKRARIWNIPRGVMNLLVAALMKKSEMKKLTENLMVSNDKLIKSIGQPLPVALKDGLVKTIKSFHE
ncbi:MAG TPA: NAD-dependent epimerase/dehydratase family protein [Cyclobacteriaceae bacterium]|nr:NAD-dependent epimerase/dehydratase family protein [Cyclobacteriaceae bacterium]